MEDSTIPVIPEGRVASTYRGSSIKTYADVANRIKLRLGSPYNQVNITDESLANRIDEAIEMYSRYAGYDREYIIFCDKALDSGCSVLLDEIVDKCLCETGLSGTALSSDVRMTSYLSATNINRELLGSGQSLMSSVCTLSGDVRVTNIELTYDKTNPWDFDICDANEVGIQPLSAYPDTITHSPEMDAWLKVEDGLGEIYPPNWDTMDTCLPLSSWWGIGESDLSAFDPKSATHVNITDIPTCTVEGINVLGVNTGKGANFKVVDDNLDTCGNLDATVQFLESFEPPSGLSGDFPLNKNTGFKVQIHSTDLFDETSYLTPVNTDFYLSTTTLEYGLSAAPFDAYYDLGRNEKRKISGVFDVTARSGSGDGGNLMFYDVDYLVAQQAFGYNGVGGRNFSRYGYDIVTHELGVQYIDMIRGRFGGGNSDSFQFDPHTQRLRIFKNAGRRGSCNGCYLLGIYLERSVSHMLSEMWVQDYATALIKITVGNTLSKFSGGNLIGGIQINGTDILSQGLEEKADLLIRLRRDNSEGGTDTPFYIL